MSRLPAWFLPTWFLPAGLGVLGFVWAMVASSPSLATGINWDSAAYLAQLASGRAGWDAPPWSSHYALGQIYWLGSAVVAPFGGTPIDGARFVNALALALTAAVLGRTLIRLSGSAVAGFLWTCAYLGSWGLAILLLSFEDNVLYLPAAAAILALCLARLAAWRPRDSVVAGALAAVGVLVSWQAGLYLFPGAYVAAVLGGPRSAMARVRDVALLFATFATVLVGWTVFLAMTSSLVLPDLVSTLFSRPEPSFFPETWRDLGIVLATRTRLFRHLGTGLAHEAGSSILELPVVWRALPQIGLTFYVTLVLATVWTTWRSWRVPRQDEVGTNAGEVAVTESRRFLGHFLALTFLVLTSATALYLDLPGDKYKRYEYVPLFFALVGAAATWRLRAWAATRGEEHGQGGARRSRRWRGVGLGLLSVLVVSEIIVVVSRARQQRAVLATLEPPGYHGRDGQPHFAYFRRLRHAHPGACTFVFALSELEHGRYQLEIPAALWSELPAHEAIGDPETMAEWPHKIVVTSAEAATRKPCAVWSPAALVRARDTR